MTDWSKKWDKEENQMDEPEKEKIEVVTEEEEKDAPTWSGLYCVYCKDLSVFIYEGNSICATCYDKETAELIKNKRKSN